MKRIVVLSEIPPRNVNWASEGKRAHLTFEKYFMRKIKFGQNEPFYERLVMDKLNIRKLKEPV